MLRKKAIVTGGSRGIGSGIVMCLARAGYDVATNYCTAAEDALALSAKIEREYGVRCFVYEEDLSKIGAVESLIERAVADMGGMDLYVNNAASTRAIGGLTDFSVEDFDYLLSLNCRSYLLGMRKAALYMAERGIRGNIINITSVRSDIAYPTDGVYGGIKAMVKRATESFALDMAPYGIRINCVGPGAIRTRNLEKQGESAYEIRKEGEYNWLANKIPLQRMGMPDDIGNAVVWLASEKASYVTGISLRVDGGLILAIMPDKPDETGKNRGWGIV